MRMFLWGYFQLPSKFQHIPIGFMELDVLNVFHRFEICFVLKENTTVGCGLTYCKSLTSFGILNLDWQRIRYWLLTALSHNTYYGWRHKGRDGVSHRQPHDCLLNCLFRRRSKKTSKLRVTGLCAGNSPVTGEFPAQRPSNAEMFPFDNVIVILNLLSATWWPSRCSGFNGSITWPLACLD